MGALLTRLYDQLYSGKQLEVAVVGIEVGARGAGGDAVPLQCARRGLGRRGLG
jgi:hypothetical protein